MFIDNVVDFITNPWSAVAVTAYVLYCMAAFLLYISALFFGHEKWAYNFADSKLVLPVQIGYEVVSWPFKAISGLFRNREEFLWQTHFGVSANADFYTRDNAVRLTLPDMKRSLENARNDMQNARDPREIKSCRRQYSFECSQYEQACKLATSRGHETEFSPDYVPYGAG